MISQNFVDLETSSHITKQFTKGGQIKYPMMLCAKISQVLFVSHAKKCSNGDFSLVEYTGIKTLKGWISSYIASSLYSFYKKCLCGAKNNSFHPLQFNVSEHIIITNGAMAE